MWWLTLLHRLVAIVSRDSGFTIAGTGVGGSSLIFGPQLFLGGNGDVVEDADDTCVWKSDALEVAVFSWSRLATIPKKATARDQLTDCQQDGFQEFSSLEPTNQVLVRS